MGNEIFISHLYGTNTAHEVTLMTSHQVKICTMLLAAGLGEGTSVPKGFWMMFACTLSGLVMASSDLWQLQNDWCLMFSDVSFDWPGQHQAETSKHQRAKSTHPSFPRRLDLIGILSGLAKDLKAWRRVKGLAPRSYHRA
jgi:hypothetical protein